MNVQAVQAQLGAVPQPGDGGPGGGYRQAELGPGLAGGDRLVGVGPDAGDHPDQDRLLAADDLLEPVDVVGVVDDDQADPGVDRHPQFRRGLGVAVHHDERGVDPAGQRHGQLAGPGHVYADSL